MAILRCIKNETSNMFTTGRDYFATPSGVDGQHWDLKDDYGHTRFVLGDDLRFITGRSPLVERIFGDVPLYARFEVIEK